MSKRPLSESCSVKTPVPAAVPGSERERERRLAHNVDWVEQMRSDGFVFVRGEVGEGLDRFHIRKDLEFGDDTDAFLVELRKAFAPTLN